MLFKRQTEMRPGHDCLFAPCQHDPKGSHGIHGDEFWHGLVTETHDGRQVALVVTVFTNRMPATVPASHMAGSKEASLADLTLHVQMPGHKIHGTSDCPFITAGPCDTGLFTTALVSDHLELGEASRFQWERDTYGPPEHPSGTLWLRIENRLVSMLADPEMFPQPDEPQALVDARAVLARLRLLERNARTSLEEAADVLRDQISAYKAARDSKATS